MRRSRSFRPFAPMPLEVRAVPSAMPAVITQLVAHDRKLGVDVHRVNLSPHEVAQSNASDVQFGLSPSDTLRAGQPVAEQLTTTYNIGSPQTETLIKVPNSSNDSVTTYRTIQLRNNGGTETVVDTETFSGGAILLSGTNNTHTVTTTLPNGSIQTETENEVITGDKTVINATIHEADGGIETWTAISVKHGPKTTENKTITEPNGTIEHQKIVTTRVGDLDSTTQTTTTSPGLILVSASATHVTRVQPPVS
jgi:hypothetical protein